jgi:hypothetical protein
MTNGDRRSGRAGDALSGVGGPSPVSRPLNSGDL